MQLSLSQRLEQKLTLVQKIEFSNLMVVPDEVINFVVGVVSHNPDSIENFLQGRKIKKPLHEDSSKKVQTIYSSLIPSKGDSGGKKQGLIISPDLRALEGHLGTRQTTRTPDVTYIGRKHEKPELVLSDHLKGAMSLEMLDVDSSKYPETSKLLSQLKNFDEWKRRILTNVYVIIGGIQREFFEYFDNTRFNVCNQKDLADKLNISIGSVSRILSNRWVEARNIAGDQKFPYTKDLLVTQDGLKKYTLLPLLNEILEKEFRRGEAYYDAEISREVGNLARRTVVKYREESGIPNHMERNESYKSGEVTEQYVFA